MSRQGLGPGGELLYTPLQHAQLSGQQGRDEQQPMWAVDPRQWRHLHTLPGLGGAPNPGELDQSRSWAICSRGEFRHSAF